MTDRLIRVTSCAGCKYYNADVDCGHIDGGFDIFEHVENETIHPDCPLEVAR